MSPAPTIGAILLAGGRASRLGGAIKPLLDIGGRSLLHRAIDAAQLAGCHPVTIAGPVLDDTLAVTWVREDPPFGGPVAGIVAALHSWDPETSPEWTLVVACDLPGIGAATVRLVRDILLLPSDTDGMCLGDVGSRPQWLIGAYRTAALRRAGAALPNGGHGARVRDLLEDLAITVVAAPPHETTDVDTWEDVNQARRDWIAPEETRHE